MSLVTEIARDLFRISTFFPEIDLQFNQFLMQDEEPLLFHTGLKELLAIMHGSSFRGNGEQALLGYSQVLREVLG